MAAQLTLFGTWETPRGDTRPAEPSPAPPPPPPEPVDPRQVWLFDGPHSVRQEAELACEQLDAVALRKAWHKARQSHPSWPGASPWPVWAEGIEYLLGASAKIGAAEQVARALALEGAAALQRFPEKSVAGLHRLRCAALGRAAQELLQEEGPTAQLPDGRPVGYLQLLAGLPEQAVVTLELQRRAWTQPKGRGLLLGYLGEALWQCGRAAEAAAAYRDAYLEDPLAVDEKELTCRPVLDLLDACAELEVAEDPKGWLPVLADLLGKIRLTSDCTPAPQGADAARVSAALLAAYRQRQVEGLNEAERITRKRELVKVAPALREQIRRL